MTNGRYFSRETAEREAWFWGKRIHWLESREQVDFKGQVFLGSIDIYIRECDDYEWSYWVTLHEIGHLERNTWSESEAWEFAFEHSQHIPSEEVLARIAEYMEVESDAKEYGQAEDYWAQFLVARVKE